MKPAFRLSLAAAALSCTIATPVMAQGVAATSPEQELAQLRAEMAALAARVDQLEGELVQARVEAAAADAERAAAAVATPAETKPATKITFKGAPEIETESGWSFKPRGRLQYDAGFTSVPNRLAGLMGSAMNCAAPVWASKAICLAALAISSNSILQETK